MTMARPSGSVRAPASVPNEQDGAATGIAGRSAAWPRAWRRSGRRAAKHSRRPRRRQPLRASCSTTKMAMRAAHCKHHLDLAQPVGAELARPASPDSCASSVMISSRSTTTTSPSTASASRSAWPERQQEDEGAAHQHLVHQRVEVAAQGAGQSCSAGQVAVEPVGEGGHGEDDQAPRPQLAA